jgi:hypothetical protein
MTPPLTTRQAILRQLDELIQAHGGPWDGLWRDLGQMGRSLDYTLLETFEERILAELDVIERRYGATPASRAIRAQVAAVSRASTLQAPIQSEA